MECYVYLHRKITNGEIFYIGKGSGKRAWKKTQRSDWWKRIEAKHGRSVEIVLRGLSEDQAFHLERGLIEWIGLDNLCNLRDGGEGGFKASVDTRKKMSAARKGRTASIETRQKMSAALMGRHVSEETRKKLRIARLAQVMPPITDAARLAMSERMKGRVVSQETRNKISASKKGIKTGRVMTDAQKDALRNARLGKPLPEDVKEKLRIKAIGRSHSESTIEKLKQSNSRLNKERRKPIRCSNGMVFSFSGDAQDWLRKNGKPTATRTNIVSCCTGRLKSAYGFTWSFDTLGCSEVF